MENKKVTLQELADVISAQAGTTKRFTDSFLRELVVVIQEYLEKDGVVKVKGLGTFKLLWIEARKSVNVATKESIVLPAHYKLTFTPEDSVKQELNAEENMSIGGAVMIQDSENEAEPIETDVSAMQPSNTPNPNPLTLLGIIIDKRLVQPLNTKLSIVNTLFGILILVMGKFSNADSPIVVTPAGI